MEEFPLIGPLRQSGRMQTQNCDCNLGIQLKHRPGRLFLQTQGTFFFWFRWGPPTASRLMRMNIPKLRTFSQNFNDSTLFFLNSQEQLTSRLSNPKSFWFQGLNYIVLFTARTGFFDKNNEIQADKKCAFTLAPFPELGVKKIHKFTRCATRLTRNKTFRVFSDQIIWSVQCGCVPPAKSLWKIRGSTFKK